MIEKIAVIAGADFQNRNDYAIIRFKVLSDILSSAYNFLVSSNEIIPLEELKPDVKQRLWDIAGKYHQEKELRIKASKAAYVLEVSSLNN